MLETMLSKTVNYRIRAFKTRNLRLKEGVLPFYLWLADVGVFIHKHTMKLLSLLVDLDISMVKETHSCESVKSSRLGMGRKLQESTLLLKLSHQ